MSSLNEAKKIVELRRNLAIQKTQDIRSKLLENEDFKNAENKLGGLDFERSRREVYKLDTSEIDKQISQAILERDNALKKLGYSVDILQPEFACKICEDTGIYNYKVCSCVEKERVKLEFEKYPELKSVPKSLDDIDFTIYDQQSKMFEKCAKYLKRNFVSEDRLSSIILFGATGVGKTYLAKTALLECMLSGQDVMFVNAIRLNKMFLEYHLAALENKKQILQKANSCDALVIDDLGVEPMLNNVTIPYLYELIIERASKKTIITTNLSQRDLENRYGQRIFSRLMDKERSAVIKLQGKDLRLSLSK